MHILYELEALAYLHKEIPFKIIIADIVNSKIGTNPSIHQQEKE